MKLKFYVDMDGVLAKWNSLASQEDTFEKGYFLNRKPDNKAIEYVQNLVNKGNDVDNNGLENIPSIFVPYGVPKLDYIILREDTTNILIDDFSKNLHEWEKGKNNIGIKYYNGINGNHGTWKGNSINPELNPLKANDSMQNDEQNIDFEILM